MKINNLSVKNFRNYKSENISFCDGINYIYGENGQGKTNIIEALYFFCTGKSFKGAKEKEIILFGEEEAEIFIDFDTEKSKNNAKIILNEEKIISLNGIGIKKLSEIVGFLKAVIFTPDHLDLIKEGPGERRHFLDVFISSIYPVYFKYLINYYKILKQKNYYLKTKANDDNLLYVLNQSLSEFAHIIFKYRNLMINNLSPYLNDYQKEISGNREDLKIYYNPSVKEKFDDKAYILDLMNKNVSKEKDIGFSLIGPHRDDFSLFINGKNIKQYGSQGQIRTSVLSLKLSECEVIKEICGEYPVLLFDDITSEIDQKRREFLFENIKNKQTFITSTEKENITNEKICYFKVEKGNAKKEGWVILMFLHLGADIVVKKDDIVAIMDMETSSLSKITKEFLKNEERRKNVINVDVENLPKSYVLVDDKKEKKLYISPIATSTLLKRANSKNMFNI